jgi:hypothetical protein
MDIYVTTLDGHIIHKIHLYSLTKNDIYIACANYCKLNPDCYINVNNNTINIINSKLIIITNLDENLSSENVHDSNLYTDINSIYNNICKDFLTTGKCYNGKKCKKHHF